jgi:hypothetical protein
VGRETSWSAGPGRDRSVPLAGMGPATGVVVKRRGIGPVEGGRRPVDIVREGFA